MTHHDHHHHHGLHEHHPHDRRVQAYPSLLRLSAMQRLAAAVGAIAVLWGAIFWAMS